MPLGAGVVIRGNESKDGTPPPLGKIPLNNGTAGDVLDTREGSEIRIGEVEGRGAA